MCVEGVSGRSVLLVEETGVPEKNTDLSQEDFEDTKGVIRRRRTDNTMAKKSLTNFIT
jgi:hypothetical protein